MIWNTELVFIAHLQARAVLEHVHRQSLNGAARCKRDIGPLVTAVRKCLQIDSIRYEANHIAVHHSANLTDPRGHRWSTYELPTLMSTRDTHRLCFCMRAYNHGT
eukprot:1176958-Prorocentrum_minimum.AAC.3